jgi:hypothetical protein
VSRSSQAILACEYGQTGLRSGVDSTIGNRLGGVWYAEAELMNTSWPARPRNRSMSACTCWGVNATTSKSRDPIAARAAAGSRMSARSSSAPSGTGRLTPRPRVSR